VVVVAVVVVAVVVVVALLLRGVNTIFLIEVTPLKKNYYWVLTVSHPTATTAIVILGHQYAGK